MIPIVDSLVPDFFLHRIRPEKGVIYIVIGAVDDALWDMAARWRKKPRWELVVDMTLVRLMNVQKRFGI